MRRASGLRCAACAVPLPAGAARCPSCGAEQGAPLVIGSRDERRDVRVATRARPRRQLVAVVAAAACLLAVLVLVDGGSSSVPAGAPALVPTTRPADAVATTTTIATLALEPDGGPRGGRLVVSGSDGAEVLDLDAREVTRQPTFTNANIIPVRGAVILGGQGSVAVVDAPYDGEPRVLGLFRNSTVLASSVPDRVWVVTSDPSTTAREIGPDGTVTVPPFDLPDQAYAAGAVNGGVLIGLHGSMYVARSGDQPRVLGTGEPLASSARTVAAVVCDERAQCRLQLIDVVTGARQPVPIDLGTGDVRAAFSPDGWRLAVLTSDREDRRLTVIDTTTDEATSSTASDVRGGPSSLSWAPSGQWVFWIAGSSVRATDVADGVTSEIWRSPSDIFSVYALAAA